MRRSFPLAISTAAWLCMATAPTLAHGKKTPHKHDKKGNHKKGHSHGPDRPKGPKELRGVKCPAGEWKDRETVKVPRKTHKAMSLEETIRWMTPVFLRAATLMDTTAQLTERDPSRLNAAGIQTNVEGYRYFDKHKKWPEGKAPDSFLLRVCGDELKGLLDFAAKEWDARANADYRRVMGSGRAGIDAKRLDSEQRRFMELAISAYKQHHYAVKWLTTQTGTTHLPTTSLKTLAKVAASMRTQAAEFLALAERSKKVGTKEASTADASQQACSGARGEWFYTQKCVTRRATLNGEEAAACKTWKARCGY